MIVFIVAVKVIAVLVVIDIVVVGTVIVCRCLSEKGRKKGDDKRTNVKGND